jgi:MazG family protein
LSRDGPGDALAGLLEIMARLRDPERGCPWDRAQSFRTIAPYTLEEAYEVADAIERGAPRKLEDELGDLLFQVVFHARMAEERGWFDFEAVTRAICAKLIRRHPHVFEREAAASDAAQVSRSWEAHKARERAAAAAEAPDGDRSALAEIALALPALMRAAKLGRRAARVGFDWENAAQVREKVLEELGELDAALAAGAAAGAPELGEELGDLLFAVANWSLHLGVDPEVALRGANAKFERRFRRMESLAGERGAALETLSAAQWDALWREAKREG